MLLQNSATNLGPIIYTSQWLTNEFNQGTGTITVDPNWMLLR
jgi:hypothetical protein